MPLIKSYEEDANLVNKAIHHANQLLSEDRIMEAKDIYYQILKVDPEAIHASHMLGLVALKEEKFDEAEAAIQSVIKAKPDWWEAYNNLGNVYSRKGDRKSAIVNFQKAYDLSNHILPRINLAVEYHFAQELKKSEEELKKCIEMEPENFLAWFNLGNLHFEQLCTQKAIECFKKSYEYNPSFNTAQWNLATTYLLEKEYEKGFEAYESRWSQFLNYSHTRKRYEQRPQWEGESLDGKTILLYAEQGAGDALQFIRYAKQLSEMGADVIMEWLIQDIRGDLQILLERVDGVSMIFDPSQEEIYEDYDFDYHQSISSIPRVLGMKSDEDIPWWGPYITPDPEFSPVLKPEFWKKYKDDYKIGIVWAGNPMHPRDRLRSCYASNFKMFKKRGRQIFSLQRDVRPRKHVGFGIVDYSKGVSDLDAVDMSPALLDYNETANIISQLDLVVTVDTAVAHLAGAMGKNAYVMLPYCPDWRWGLDGDTTSWYPTIRLFRQEQPNDWESAFNQAAEYLETSGV